MNEKMTIEQLEKEFENRKRGMVPYAVGAAELVSDEKGKDIGKSKDSFDIDLMDLERLMDRAQELVDEQVPGAKALLNEMLEVKRTIEAEKGKEQEQDR